MSDEADPVEARERATVRSHDANWALWAVLRAADEAQHAFAAALGLPYTDAVALDHVLRAEAPLGPGELGRRLGISSASATVLVDRMVAAGHLLRGPHPEDRRRRVVTATATARASAYAALAPLLADLDDLAATLTEEQSRTVTAYLREVTRIHRDHTARPRPS